MGRRRKTGRKIISYVLIFAMLAGMVRQEAAARAQERRDATQAEYVSRDCRILYKTLASWGNCANVDISITNEGDSKVNLWELEFHYSAQIQNIWNADVLSDGGSDCRVGAKTYNSVIEKGQTVSFGFTACAESGQPEPPEQITLTDEQSRRDEEQTGSGTGDGAGSSAGESAEPTAAPGVTSIRFPEKWKGLNYALFTSGDNDLSLYTYKTHVGGDVHTNRSFTYQGTTLDVKGTLEAAGSIDLRTSSMADACLVTAKKERAGRIEIPDITKEVREYARQTGESFDGGKSYDSDTVSLKKPIYVDGNVVFNATSFRGQGIVYAGGSVAYNVGQLTTHKNSRIFMAAEDGDITLNGSEINMDAVLYAPNGCVRINANNFNLNGRIIARQVCINGTTVNINAGDGDFDMLPFLLRPEIGLTVAGRQKVNRKVTVDIEELENTEYIIKENTEWRVTKDGEDAEGKFRVDEGASDEYHREMLFVEPGTYTVSASVTTGKADFTAIKEIVVEEDLAPEAGFSLEKTYVTRDKNGVGTVTVTDSSLSPDGDRIGNRYWYIYYDKNNDGFFSECEKSLVSDANKTEITYSADKVGKYKVSLEVKEHFTDTIRHLIDDSAFLRGDTSGKAEEGCVFEVGNDAPSANLDIEKSKSADIVCTVGEADRGTLDTYYERAAQLREALEKKGIDARVDVADSSVITAKDHFAWEEFDHYNYRDWYLPTMEKHILYGDEDIRMMGYSERPMKDFLYVADDSPGKKVFEFDLQKDRADWHSMEGGGFLFNTAVSEEKNSIQGFCILVSQNGLKLVQIDCKNLAGFRNGSYNYVQHAGRLLRTFSISGVKDKHHFRIETDGTVISAWDGEKLVIDRFVLPENNYGFGYGPIVSHSSHGCWQQSYFTFQNIVMRTEKGRSLGDIISGYEWRPGAAHYVLNLSEEEVPELTDGEAAAELTAALINNEAAFAGIGNETNENQYRFLLNAAGTGGMYREADEIGRAMEEIGAYVEEGILARDYSIGHYVTTDDIISYRDFYQDSENDPLYEAEWLYEYDPTVFAENDGEAKQITRKGKKPITVFEDPGAYAIWLRVKDNPAGENDALDEYRKWSEQAEANKLLLAHRRPEASVECTVAKDASDPLKCTVNTEYHASDADHPDDGRNGIREEQYYYKNIRDAEWTEGKMPNKVEMGQTYLVKYIVRDIEGAYSFPATAIVRTSDCLSYEEIKDDTPPTVHIQADKLEIAPGETVQIEGYAEDDYGIDDFRLYINDEEMLSAFGRVNYTAGEEGALTVRATAVDIGGNETEETLRIEVADRSDRTAPTAQITSPKSGSDIGTNIEIKGTAKDETAFEKYTLSYRVRGEEEYTVFATDTEEVEDGLLGTLDVSRLGQGVYEILLTAEDKAGNQSHFGLLLYIETRQKTEETSYSLRAAISGINYDEAAQKIDIYGSVLGDGHMKAYSLGWRQEGEGEYTQIAAGTEEAKEVLLGSIRTEDLDAGDYELKLEVSDACGNKATATASFEYVVERTETTVTVTQVINPEPEIAKPEASPERTALPGEASASPTGTSEPVATSAPAATPAGTGLPAIGQEELDGILNRTFGLTLSQDIAYTGTQVTAYVTLPCTVEAESIVITMDGRTIAEGAKSVSFTKGKAGTVTIAASGVNHLGEKVSDSKQCTFYSQNDKNPPVAAFDLPEGDAVLTEPTDITGSAYDAEELDYYTLEYRVDGAGEYTLIEKSAEPKRHEVLGRLDTTVLPNGRYEVRLSAVDKGGNRRRIVRKYTVEGGLKVGPMNLGFTDITASMGGTRVNVNRTYSSANKNKGDFGIGWSLGMQGMTLSETNPLHSGYSLDVGGSWFAPSYSLNETKNHDIVIAYGDGTSDRFELTLTPNRQALIPIYEVELGYRCATNPRVKLEIDGENTAVIEGAELLFNDISMYGNVKYKLTTEDGVAVYLSAANGVTRMEDPNGNVIRVDRDGYHSDDGRSITFTRDKLGRIAIAEDPNGKQTQYGYDADGNLSTVADHAGRTVTFGYDSDHNLTTITDPAGIAVARNEYNEEGRLIATIDADGNRMEYEYDVEGRTQVVKDRLGNPTVYVYDDRGNILQQTDANGNTTKSTYDSKGNLTSRTDANGNTIKYAYDSSGNITSVTAADGTTVKSTYTQENLVSGIRMMDKVVMAMKYDDRGRITSVGDANGNATEYSYTEDGKLTGLTDAIGTFQKITYDSEGNVSTTTNGAGESTSYTYDKDGRCTGVTISREENGERITFTSHYSYNAAGEITQSVDNAGNATSYEYDERGNQTASVDAKGRRIAYAYDDLGNMVKTTYPDGTFETFTYDANGNNVTATDRSGLTVTMKYDKLNRMTQKVYADGTKETYSYDAVGNVTEQISASGAVTKYEYDSRNRNTAITDAFGSTTTFTYDEASKLTKRTDAEGNQICYEYDENGNRIRTTYADGNSVSFRYDARNRVTEQTDQNGNKTCYEYDGADRLTKVTDADGNSYTYQYDGNGNLASVTDALQHTVRYGYDKQGRVSSVTNALGQTMTNVYDETGNLKQSTDYVGTKTTYEYDGMDQMTEKNVGEDITRYTYSDTGLLISVTDKTGTITYAYDKYNRLKKKTDAKGITISYTYDGAGRISAFDNGFGKTKYEYDVMDRLTRVIDRNGQATVYEYDALGNRSAVHYPNGNVVTYAYDACQRLKEECIVNADGTALAKYSYGRGKAGEKLTVKETSDGKETEIAYQYDRLNRLTKETIRSGSNTLTNEYSYDAVSNRLTRETTVQGDLTELADVELDGAEVTEGTTTYTYNALNQLETEKRPSGSITYIYDANGNRIRQSGSKTIDYSYDKQNRLQRATIQQGNSVTIESYTYDYVGNRTSRTVNESETTNYVVDTSGELAQVAAETDRDGNETASYTRGDELLSMDRGGKVWYYLYDGHGNVRRLTDGTGTTTDRYTYDASGNLLKKEGDTENEHLYTGEQYNAATGLYYLRARYMDPSTGTFISMDSYQGSLYDPVSLHKYLYANANPVMNTDPSGYSACAIDAGVYISCSNTLSVAEVCYNAMVLNIGLKLISQLRALQAVEAAYVLPSEAIMDIGAEGAFSGRCGTAEISSQLLLEALDAVTLAYVFSGDCIALDITSSSVEESKAYVESIAIPLEEFERKPENKGKVCVYLLRDSKNSYKVSYVGITNDPWRREREHKRDKNKMTGGKPWKMYIVADGLTRGQARATEQALICIYTIQALANARHEIAEKNYDQFELEFKRASSICKIPLDKLYEVMRR